MRGDTSWRGNPSVWGLTGAADRSCEGIMGGYASGEARRSKKQAFEKEGFPSPYTKKGKYFLDWVRHLCRKYLREMPSDIKLMIDRGSMPDDYRLIPLAHHFIRTGRLKLSTLDELFPVK